MNNWDDLVVFKLARGRQSIPSPIITINKVGLGFNVAFIREYDLLKYTRIQLSYSKSKNAIVIFFIGEAHTKGLKLSRTRGDSRNITCVSFFNKFNLLPPPKGKYIPVKDTHPTMGECYVIYLDRNANND